MKLIRETKHFQLYKRNSRKKWESKFIVRFKEYHERTEEFNRFEIASEFIRLEENMLKYKKEKKK